MIDPELRDRLALRLIRWVDSRGTMGEAVDAVLAELEAAGRTDVETASLERLRAVARAAGSLAADEGMAGVNTDVARLAAAFGTLTHADLGDTERGPVDLGLPVGDGVTDDTAAIQRIYDRRYGDTP